ncbi:MAG: HEAT repeat domain-containing protein [Chthoniobacteraceae bacterium]
MKIFILLLSRQSLRKGQFCILAAATWLLITPGCSRKPLPKPAAVPDASPTQALADRSGAGDARRPAPLLPAMRMEIKPVAPDSSGLLELLGPPTTPEAAAKQAAELERDFKTERDFAPRVEAIYRLADASSLQSREVLRALFFAETDLDMRVEMVTSLSFVESEDLKPSLPIFQEALKPTQPRELREAALDTIQSLHDPRTIPLLQVLLADEDPELRETAMRTIEYFQEVLERESR